MQLRYQCLKLLFLNCHPRLSLALIDYIFLDLFVKIDNVLVEDLETVFGVSVLGDELQAVREGEVG